MMKMKTRFLYCFAALLMSAVSCQEVSAQSRSVVLEIYQSRYSDLATQHTWMEMLSEVGATVRSKTSESPVRPSIEEVKSDRSTTIRVKGYIDGKRLHLPGGRFSITDKTGIRNLIQKLKDDGAEVALAEKQAFGLTAPQLVAVHEDLSSPVDFSTRDQHVGESVLKMISGIKTPVVLSREARKVLTGRETIVEELKGLSVGTALAAAVRPLGLVVTPHRKQGKNTEIHLVRFSDAEENWPVGWPTETNGSRVAPKLFAKTDLEIKGFPLKATMDAIEKRSGIPFLYDHNTLARKELDMSEIRVTLVRKNTSYMTGIRKLLSQTSPQMFKELRVDENGKPFLWISTKR